MTTRKPSKYLTDEEYAEVNRIKRVALRIVGEAVAGDALEFSERAEDGLAVLTAAIAKLEAMKMKRGRVTGGCNRGQELSPRNTRIGADRDALAAQGKSNADIVAKLARRYCRSPSQIRRILKKLAHLLS
jgi:hypothetical protein